MFSRFPVYDVYVVVRCYAHKQEWCYKTGDEWWRSIHFYLTAFWGYAKFMVDHSFFFCSVGPLLCEAYWCDGELAVWREVNEVENV